MRCYQFEFIVTTPGVTFESMSYDMADIYMTFDEHPFVQSCDMFNIGEGTGVSMLIVTDILTIEEIEAILLEKFQENGRNAGNYILMTPEGEYV